MLQVNTVLNRIFDVLFYPFHTLSPFWFLNIVSLLTAVIMLLIFRWVSNQAGIGRTKDLIKAHFLEIPLFRHDLKLIFQSQIKIMRHNLTYMRYAIMPMLVMILPIALILIHLNLRLGHTPLRPGQSAIVFIKLKEGTLRRNALGSMGSRDIIALNASAGLEVETPPLRIIDEDEVDWRIKAKRSDQSELVFRVKDKEYKKVVVMTDKHVGFAPSIESASFLGQILNPIEPPLPTHAIIKSIKIDYPTKYFKIHRLNIHWIIFYFGLSIIFAFALKGIFKVEV